MTPVTWINAEAARSQMSVFAWNLISSTGSLTNRLRNMSDGKMIFRLLFANWGSANSDERQILNLEAQEPTWVRRIEHCYKNRLWVSARVIFPKSTIKATKNTLSGLGIQPLGDLIFKDSSLKRQSFTYCLLNKEQNYCPTLTPIITAAHTNAWARRSVLYFQNQPLLITEIFMPDAYTKPKP